MGEGAGDGGAPTPFRCKGVRRMLFALIENPQNDLASQSDMERRLLGGLSELGEILRFYGSSA